MVIFAGVAVAMFVPMVDILSSLFLKFSFLPNRIFLLIVFPLSIGYAIARHDLFEIDVVVRRTYGYMMSTATIVGAYALIVSVLNFTFQSAEVSRSPLFSITFALVVVFLFEPLHRRIQNFVDRVFYRQRYDYRATLKNASEAMTSILDKNQIVSTFIGSLVREMFLENGVLLLRDLPRKAFCVQYVEGVDPGSITTKELGDDDELVRVMTEKKDAIPRHEIELNPIYEPNRETLQKRLDLFASEVVVPVNYKDSILGIISLGRKKSGKMFTPEDIDLMKTMTSQSAIALENARLFEENLEKGRMEEELRIAHDIQAGMLPDKAPEIEGFKIVARSIPAREVGGDFYDFIEIGGNGTQSGLGIVIGDVSGKGVSAALMMSASRSTYRILVQDRTSVEEVMNLANQRLNRDIKKGMFVALLYAVLDPREKTLTLSNAGQTQPIILSGEGSKPLLIDSEGDRFPLGIVDDCHYQETQVQLKKGDVVALYTDGVVEALNSEGEMYGFERLMVSIEEGSNLDENNLLEKLMDDVSCYVGGVEQHDDLTIVIVKAE
jgi:serine phosphatase RsbU (regulator of sigma subunit)